MSEPVYLKTECLTQPIVVSSMACGQNRSGSGDIDMRVLIVIPTDQTRKANFFFPFPDG